MFSHVFTTMHAPEFPAGLSWLNGPPLSMKSLRGKAVLLHFFGVSSPASLHVLSSVTQWQSTYADAGFAVIGIHVPSLEVELIPQVVAQELKRLGIDYPVVLDAQGKIWHMYANRFLPRAILIDAQGRIVADHAGEEGWEGFARVIEEVLFHPVTPSVSLGLIRGSISNVQEAVLGEEYAFTDPQGRKEGCVFLHGHFVLTNDSVAHTRSLPTPSEYLTVMYRGCAVEMVARGLNHHEAIVDVEIDGKPIAHEACGEDIEEKNGRTIVRVAAPRLYHLVRKGVYQKKTLTLRTASDCFECFTLSFGGCNG